MKAEHPLRAATLCLCLLACSVVIVLVLGAGAAVGVAAAAPPSPQQQLTPEFLHELQQLNIDLLAGAPVVTDVNPNGGLTAGGGEVVITGAGFTDADAVTFGGTPATIHAIDSDTQLRVTAPAHAAGTVQVQVTAASKLVSPDTSADDYTYVEPPATTIPPTTVPPTTVPSIIAEPVTSIMDTPVATVAEEDGGRLSGGWIALIAVVAVLALAALGTTVYMIGKRSSKGGPAA